MRFAATGRYTSKLDKLKTKRSRRTVQFNERVAGVLREHRAHVDALAAKHPDCRDDPYGMVFPTLRASRGGHMPGRLWSPTEFGQA